MILIDPSHGAVESVLVSFAFMNGPSVKDDLHSTDNVSVNTREKREDLPFRIDSPGFGQELVKVLGSHRRSEVEEKID